ncbi:hypothetical protein [Methylocaldum sp.]|uniref:hypothetical protein n=1 Tax=Methylocaldum sp. TaxID=1969727 RepID=UPI002D3D25AF|nr:hypothetical protein [Methylocaldum sp.]HYE37866.1 hypothetical protein [Methylocaldum sp.]
MITHSPLCWVDERCRKLAIYDLRKPMSVPGLAGEHRFLCEDHGKSLSKRYRQKYRMGKAER